MPRIASTSWWRRLHAGESQRDSSAAGTQERSRRLAATNFAWRPPLGAFPGEDEADSKRCIHRPGGGRHPRAVEFLGIHAVPTLARIPLLPAA